MPAGKRKFWRSMVLCAALAAAASFHLPCSAAAPAEIPRSTSAQGPAGYAADGEPAFLDVSITLEASGRAIADASFYLVDSPELRPTAIKEALQSALRCQLEDDRNMLETGGFYLGSCVVPSSSPGLLRQGRLSTLPLQNFARLHGIGRFSITLRLPEECEVAETVPAPVRPNVPASLQPRLPASLGRWLRSVFVFAASPEQPLPSEIAFRYGYAPSTVKRAAAILVAILLAPLAFFLWLGRKALAADVPDKAVVWFSYMRSLAWILNGTLVGWWFALDYCHAQSLLGSLSSGTRFASLASHPAVFEAFSWLPPAVLWLFLYRLSHPVQQKLRGLSWTKRELTVQAFYSVLAQLFPFAMFLIGLRIIANGSIRDALYWWLGAFLLRVVAAQALLKANGIEPQAVSSGDLRDRAFVLAERLGVNLEQVYLIPSGKGQVVNAFASSGNTVAFTDLLLRRMSQREVDYVLGHELTHLQLKHPAKLAYARIGSWLLAFFFLNLSTIVLQNEPAVRYALIFLVVSIFPFFWSRRFEYAADRGAVAATRDPRAAISALFKLSELNMMPVHWSKWREKWLTHPSSLRRARAIAKRAGIPFEEIPAIARGEVSEAAAENYTIPATAAPGAKLHSTQRSKSMSLKLSLALLFLFACVPSLASLCAIHSPSPLNWIFFAAAAPLTLASFLFLSNYATRLTRGDIAAALKTKLAGQGIQADAWKGAFVNFSPAAMPRLYDRNATWDIGYLFLRSGRLCYCGEETSFALRQNQITGIRLGIGMPSFLPAKRIYIAWNDVERGSCGVFNFACGNANSAMQSNQLTAHLFREIESWWKTAPVSEPLSPQLAGLSSPQIRAVTSQSFRAGWTGRRVSNVLLWTGIFSAAAAALCNLPFHFTEFLLILSNPYFYPNIGTQNHFSSPGAGWFAVAVAMLVRLLTMIPALRYRETPQLIAEAPTRAQATPPPPPTRNNLTEKTPVA